MERLASVAELMKELGFSQKEAFKKAKGFMFIYFGWLVLYWSNPIAYDHPDKEIRALMEILGLPEIEI